MLDFVITVASCDRLFSGLQNRELLQDLLASVTKVRDELEPSTIAGRWRSSSKSFFPHPPLPAHHHVPLIPDGVPRIMLKPLLWTRSI